MATLKNHPNMWLRDDAAASLERYEQDHGVLPVNSAGRTQAEQQDAINRWNRGGTYNRPPYLYKPYEPAWNGPHVRGGGVALDTSAIARFRANGAAYGWDDPLPGSDPVHFEYNPARDTQKHRGSGASTGSVTQDVKNRQSLLNDVFGVGLKVDGVIGAATIAATKRYQELLRGFGYTGAIDGLWGDGTQAAHQRRWDAWKASRPVAGNQDVRNRQKLLNDIFGVGLAVDGVIGPRTVDAIKKYQYLLRGFGYSGAIDGVWGSGVQAAHQRRWDQWIANRR